MKQKKTCKMQPPAGRTVLTALVLLALLFLLSALLLAGEEPASSSPPPSPASTLPVVTPPPAAAATPRPGWDAAQTLRLLHSADGTVEELSLSDYLWGVVAAEMPASFLPEALKAQTVAARTYCLRQRAQRKSAHPDADVCDDFTCCQAFLPREAASVNWGGDAQRYTDKIALAVQDTDGLVCLYGGELIDAVFFSSASEQTCDAKSVWGKDVPYLSSVATPEGSEVPGFHTLVDLTPEDFSQTFLAAHPDADLSGDPAGWFSGLTRDSSGIVKSLQVGGVDVSGGEMRALFSLRSARFSVDAGAERVSFSVTGYGHGVGLSQYGSNALAGEGRNFEEILKWYYTGVSVAGMPQSYVN